MSDTNGKIKKISIIVSRGSLDGVYPGLIMANGARMEGIEANLFFTFFGLYAVLKKYMGHIKIATGLVSEQFPGLLPGDAAHRQRACLGTYHTVCHHLQCGVG